MRPSAWVIPISREPARRPTRSLGRPAARRRMSRGNGTMTELRENETSGGISLPDGDLTTLREVSQRVLWLSTAIVDAANRGRPNASGVKVGGHQASSASMVDIMVALWFHELTSLDRVSVKPHASPVLHAI